MHVGRSEDPSGLESILGTAWLPRSSSPTRVDSGPGGTLAQAMRDEIAVMYDGLDLDSETMPKAGPAELSPPGGAFLVGYIDGSSRVLRRRQTTR